MTTKIFLHQIGDHLEAHGEVKPSQSTLYKLSSLGELPNPCDYFGSRPRFDADEVLASWRARVQRQTKAALELRSRAGNIAKSALSVFGAKPKQPPRTPLTPLNPPKKPAARSSLLRIKSCAGLKEFSHNEFNTPRA
jgi:hypothetical protein